ncbi:MAG TPA: hypothetical protein VFE18_10000 [Phenylobacterium sp.]|uniref:hypothetical protein n=1 Tax=Phenylobacterium sp. TaxID=1871053 RepID=UPI002D3079BF|nr:hypothetical protein [Phenylobacterium sp.]HZZ68493.1 hypothetical protein [Phenylobacterium sp.]
MAWPDAPMEPRADAEGAVTLVDLNRLWIRHQRLGLFRLDYDGSRPMVVFLFTPASPEPRANGFRAEPSPC